MKSRNREDEDARRRQEDEGKGKVQQEGGETRGDIDKTMNVDMMEEEEFQERKKDLRENKVPLVILQGSNWKRVAQLGEIQGIWEMPRKMNNAAALVVSSGDQRLNKPNTPDLARN